MTKVEYKVNVPDISHEYTLTKDQVLEALELWCAMNKIPVQEGEQAVVARGKGGSHSNYYDFDRIVLTVKVKG